MLGSRENRRLPFGGPLVLPSSGVVGEGGGVVGTPEPPLSPGMLDDDDNPPLSPDDGVVDDGLPPEPLVSLLQSDESPRPQSVVDFHGSVVDETPLSLPFISSPPLLSLLSLVLSPLSPVLLLPPLLLPVGVDPELGPIVVLPSTTESGVVVPGTVEVGLREPEISTLVPSPYLVSTYQTRHIRTTNMEHLFTLLVEYVC